MITLAFISLIFFGVFIATLRNALNHAIDHHNDLAFKHNELVRILREKGVINEQH